MLNSSFSSNVCICFFKLCNSVLVTSITSFIGCMSLTSARTLRMRSLTCASVSLFSSMVSYIRSKTSLLLSKICASVVDWFFASESILFRNVSTGLSKVTRHVIAQRVTVAAADA